jgi:hypothetical protein
MKKILFLLLSLIFLSLSKNKCGGIFRWNIKICSDGYFNDSNLKIIKSDIKSLNNIKRKSVNKNTKRLDEEKILYTIECKIKKVIKEKDGDFHYHLQSIDGKWNMVGEIPDPNCKINKKSFFIKNFRKIYGKSNNLDTSKIYSITGVYFFDMIHPSKVIGESLNSSELHPIISIEILK